MLLIVSEDLVPRIATKSLVKFDKMYSIVTIVKV